MMNMCGSYDLRVVIIFLNKFVLFQMFKGLNCFGDPEKSSYALDL